MAELHEDDLFRHSSMSFGAHLEELRRRLFRAAGWLLLGVIVGFIFGRDVILLIERPMNDALRDFYDKKTQDELNERGGKDAPTGDAELINEGYTSEPVFVQPNQVLQGLSKKFPALAKPAAEAPAAENDDLLPITIWQRARTIRACNSGRSMRPNRS